MMRIGAVMFLVLGCSFIAEPADAVRCERLPGMEDPCPPGQFCLEGVCQDSDCIVSGRDEGCGEAGNPGTGQDDDCDGRIDEGIPEICDGLDNDCDGVPDQPEAFSSMEEFCDGTDDDCDGSIDEDFDADGDDFTTCGCVPEVDVACPAGGPVDCNDEDPTVNPEAPERCNSTDHDCDGTSVPDDLSALDTECARIAPGTICDPGSGCIRDDCTAPRNACEGEQICDTTLDPPACVDAGCTPSECLAASQWCDPGTGECQPRRGNGEPCDLPEQCMGLVCLEPGAARLPASIGAKICMQTCCGDADCGADEFCWDAGNGARTCLPVGTAQAVTGRTTLGSGPADSACSAGSQCRSGYCEGSRCLGTCTTDEQCGGSRCLTVERRGPDGPRTVQACASGSRRSRLSECEFDSQCNGACYACSGASCAFCEPFPSTCGLCEDADRCQSDGECSGLCQYFQSGTESGIPGIFMACKDDMEVLHGPACCSNRFCGERAVCSPRLGSGGGSETWLSVCVPAPGVE